MNPPIDPTDWQLLDRFARSRDQDAFRQLVARHIDLVHGTARRTLGAASPHLDDVVQAVFLLLSQKAPRIPRRGALPGWIFRATRFCCANVVKTERRRRFREREVAAMPTPSPVNESLAPLLDDGLALLGDRERQTILLHYLQRHSLNDTALRLSISPDAAKKRLERGLQKLRGFFRKKGYAIPAAAVAALLVSESAKAAPPTLTAAIATSLAANTAANTAATTIAQGALHMMRLFQLKLLALAAATCLILGAPAVLWTASVAGHNASAAPPATGAAAVAGRRPMMVRWDVLMNDAGAQRIIAALTPVKTNSVGYTAYRGPVEKVRAAILAGPKPAEPAPRGRTDLGYDLFAVPFGLGWASMNNITASSTPDFGLDSHAITGTVPIGPTRNIQAVIAINGTGPVHAKPVKGAVALDLEGSLRDTNILLSDNTPHVAKQVRMNYAGDVPVGDAVVFAGLLLDHLGVQVWQVSVWESFAASPDEYAYLQAAAVMPWVTRGPSQPLADADQAIAWASTGKTALDKVEPAFEKRLDTGAIVRLVAVCRPAQWPDCWWDATGNAVALDVYSGNCPRLGEAVPATLRVAITAEDTSVADPVKSTGNVVMIRSTYSGPRHAMASAPAEEGLPVELGVAAGPWKDGGKIGPGQEVTAGGVRVKFLKFEEMLPANGTFPGSSWIQYQATRQADVQIAIIAFDKQGREIATNQPGEPMPPEILFDRQAAQSDDMAETSISCAAAASAVDHYIVRWRPRQWVTFTQFAAHPAATPGQTRAVASASAPASAPAADTPESFMRELTAAAATGEAKKLRALMAPNTALAAQYADVTADQITALFALRNAAQAKFGPAETATAMGEMLPNLENSLITGWKVEGDRATAIYKDQNTVIIGPGNSLVRVKGQWKMEVALPDPLPDDANAQLQTGLPRQMAQNAAVRALASDITAGKYKDAYEARDALAKLLSGGGN